MPYSFNIFDNEIRAFVLANLPDHHCSILDVGAGAGKYRDLLYDYPNMDAVEVWKAYIAEYKLNERYRCVYSEDITKVKRMLDHTCDLQEHDLVIFGDVLEHLTVEEAQKVLAECKGVVIVAVPYLYKQEEINGNPFEEHKQADLTHELFMERYPGFNVLVRNNNYGVYVKGGNVKSKLSQPKEKIMMVDMDQLRALNANILIATPLQAGSVCYQYVVSICETQRKLIEEHIDMSITVVSGHAVDCARNRLISIFMSRSKFTHLLFIDGDHGWKSENVLKLLAMQKDVIGIVARKKTSEVKWAANIPEGKVHIDKTGAMEIPGEMGTGFLMITREVIEKMFIGYPELHVIHPESSASQTEKDNYYALFQFVIEDGLQYSEDITFCKRWKAIGGKLYCDPCGEISHIGSYDYRGSIQSLFQGEANEKG